MRNLMTLLMLTITISMSAQITDTRDNKQYDTVTIGTQTWMAQNLNYGTMGVEKFCYNNLESNCTLYGGLYNWDKAMANNPMEAAHGLCPAGWHMPTKAEVTILYDYLGGIMECGYALKKEGKVWEPYLKTSPSTNSSGFTATFTGTRWSTGAYKYINSAGIYWTSSSEPQHNSAYYFGVLYYTPVAQLGEYYTNDPVKGSQAAGIRCIKD